MAAILEDDIFKCIFLNENENSNSSFTEVCSWCSNRQWPSIGLDNGLAPNRCQAIIWNNVDQIYWRIYVSLSRNELMQKRRHSHY